MYPVTSSTDSRVQGQMDCENCSNTLNSVSSLSSKLCIQSPTMKLVPSSTNFKLLYSVGQINQVRGWSPCGPRFGRREINLEPCLYGQQSTRRYAPLKNNFPSLRPPGHPCCKSQHNLTGCVCIGKIVVKHEWAMSGTQADATGILLESPGEHASGAKREEDFWPGKLDYTKAVIPLHAAASRTTSSCSLP